jgi:hypothetical protein
MFLSRKGIIIFIDERMAYPEVEKTIRSICHEEFQGTTSQVISARKNSFDISSLVSH